MKVYIHIKSILDILLAAISLVILSPFMLITATAIKLDSKGPILFKQKRPGKKGKIFTISKFRTMRVETEENGRPLGDMERMTRVGNILRKTSIDELPQLFNILTGNMSFIGPRPLLDRYLEHYTPEQMRRHDVKPGISGWAQVNGRNTITWEEKFKLDVWYVDHISFGLDVKIIVKTILSVLSKSGVNNSSNDTMPTFTGMN